MNPGFVAPSDQGTVPIRRPHPAFIHRQDVKKTLQDLLAAITVNGRDIGYPHVRAWRERSWFQDLVAACASAWCRSDDGRMHPDVEAAEHEKKDRRDGLPLRDPDGQVVWRFWPAAPVIHPGAPEDRLPFCHVTDARGKTLSHFSERLLAFLARNPRNLFLDAPRAQAAAEAAIATLDLSRDPGRAGYMPYWTARAWQGSVDDLGQPFLFDDLDIRLTPPVAQGKTQPLPASRPPRCDFGVIVRDGHCDLEATKRFQDAAIAAIS